MFRLAFIISSMFVLLNALSGCATLSKSQCKVGDWHGIGKTDGEEGHFLDRFKKHKEACSAHKIKANKVLYIKGRKEGLKTYCQIQNQISRGIVGIKYRPVCSGKIVPILIEANHSGYQVYTVKLDLNNTLNQISEVRSQLNSENIKPAEKERLQDEERRLGYQVYRLENELKRLKEEGERTLTEKARAFYKQS